MLAWLFKRDRQAWVIGIRYATWHAEMHGTVKRTTLSPMGLARIRHPGAQEAGSEISVATFRTQRGRGVGLFGVQIATEFAAVHGWPTPVAYIRADNHPSIGLFAKAGYEMAGASDGWVSMLRRTA